MHGILLYRLDPVRQDICLLKQEYDMKKIDKLIAGMIRGFHIYNDTILGAILFLGSLILFIQSFSISLMKEPVSPVDTAKFFPQLVFGVLMPIGILLIIRGLIRAKDLKKTAPEGEKLEAGVSVFKRSIVALVAIAVFIALMEPIGFIPMAIIYMLFNMFYMCEKKAWKPVTFVIVAVCVAVGAYFIFRQFIYVKLPTGILKGVLG